MMNDLIGISIIALGFVTDAFDVKLRKQGHNVLGMTMYQIE